jgi:hypothetical protein
MNVASLGAVNLIRRKSHYYTRILPHIIENEGPLQWYIKDLGVGMHVMVNFYKNYPKNIVSL